MLYEHDKCSGEVEIISDGYALCTLCGDEGEYVAVDESDDKITVVAIPLPTCNRLDNF
jgi:hypothetical protein